MEAGPVAASADDEALFRVVFDAQADVSVRRDAVANVIDRGSPKSVDALLAQLTTSTDGTLRRVLVQGLRACRKPPAAAGSAVMAIAKELEPALVDDAAEVVGRCAEAEQIKQLSKIASDRGAPAQVRYLAVSALGYHRSQESVRVILPLLSAEETVTMRTNAGATLARITGIDDHGSDRDRWMQWWSQAQVMSAAQWQAHLLANFTRRSETLARQRSVLQERLITALRQRYRAVAKDEREGILVSMLIDPLDAVRELALDLVREIVNTEQVGPVLTKSLLTRLDDTSPSIRAGATLLLRDLKNAEAADVIARRLAEEIEKDRSVLRAYLIMMRRQPRLAAIGPAIALLSDPAVRADAAGAILAGIDHQPSLLGSEQSVRVATFLRTQLSMEAQPEPRFVELLGRVGSSSDFHRIQGWLDHEAAAVKEAAARAWIAAGRSLAPLAKRSADPIIQAIVIPAATERGNGADTLLALIEHRPKNEQFAAAWGRALVAMAPRVDPDAVVAADARLSTYEDLIELRLQILSAAINKLGASAAAAHVDGIGGSERQVFTLQLIDLLLARAEVRLRSDAKATLADLGRVVDLKVDLVPVQSQRYTLTSIHARILTGELDEAFLKASKYLVSEPTTDEGAILRDRIIELLFQCTDHCLKAKQIERAGQLIGRLRAGVAKPIPLRLETRLAVMEERIRLATETP